MPDFWPDELSRPDCCPKCRWDAAEERAAAGLCCTICHQPFHDGEPAGPCHRCRPPVGEGFGLVTARWAAAWEASQEALRASETPNPTHLARRLGKVPENLTARAAIAAGMTVCPRCNAQWGGLKTAHCAACHATFSTVSNFDRHRDGTHPGGRHCLTPQEVGLVDSGRAYPCWGMPGREEENAA